MNGKSAQPAPTAAHSTRPKPAVLVALDGSAAAASALPVAQRLAAQLEMPLHVLHVAVTSPAAKQASQALHLGPSTTGAPALKLDVRVGDPSTEILRAIEAPDTFLTVLTTHGRTIETGRHLGHVAAEVIARTMRPILLIRPEAAATATAAVEMRRFLLPLDGKAATARALGRITDIVHRLGGSFDVLFVADPAQLAKAAVGGEQESEAAEQGDLGIPRYVDQLQHEWPAWMHEVLDHLSACSARYPLGVPVRVHVAGVSAPFDGTIASVVLRFVAEHQDNVIVLVRRSRFEPGRAEILRTLLDLAPCPMLLTGTPGPLGSHPRRAAGAI